MGTVQLLSQCSDVADYFALAKKLVRDQVGAEQAGLLLGFAELGLYKNGFVGAFYSPGANTIIVNRMPLVRLRETRPDLYSSYLFHVILHEYVHSVGVYDEAQTRALVKELCEAAFGIDHPVTQFARDSSQFMPHLTYPDGNFQEPADLSIDFVLGIDKENTNYIN